MEKHLENSKEILQHLTTTMNPNRDGWRKRDLPGEKGDNMKPVAEALVDRGEWDWNNVTASHNEVVAKMLSPDEYKADATGIGFVLPWPYWAKDDEKDWH